MKNQKAIHGALPIVAAAYGNKFGVKIDVQGDQAYTNGERIVIPNISNDVDKDALWGYLAHEAAHVRFTNFSVARRQGFHGAMLNILEDCRIERAMPTIYPGTAHTLHETARYMLEQGMYEVPNHDSPPSGILTAYCLYWLQCEGVGQTVLREYLERTQKVYEHVIPKGIQVRLNVLLVEALSTTSTADVLDLTNRIVAMLEDEEQKEQQANAPDSSDSSDDSQDDSQAGGDISDDGSDDDSQSGGNTGDDASNDDSQGTSSSKTNSGNTTDDKTGGTQELIRQILDADEEDCVKDAHEALTQELVDHSTHAGYQPVLENSPVSADDMSRLGKELRSEVVSLTSQIRQQLIGLVQASNRTKRHRKDHGRRINHTSLSKLVVGDTKVFRAKKLQQDPNTAVHLLVDMSSSMFTKRRDDIARESALALALALESINGVNPAVTYFQSSRSGNVQTVVKHGERVLPNVGKFCHQPNGCTPLAEGIWYAASEIIKTKETRKIIFILSDGEADDVSATHEVIKLCTDGNIEFAGIGIESNAIRGYVSNSIVIDSCADLQRYLFDLMQDLLIAS